MDWLRYSGIWLTLVLNPLHWRIGKVDYGLGLLDGPNKKEFAYQVLFLTVRVVLDNGDW
jgi:hypothetical protein